MKALNHIGYHELEDDARPPGAPDRRAAAKASDDVVASSLVAGFVDRLGFDPVEARQLSAGAWFQPGTAIFDGRLDRGGLEDALRDAEIRRRTGPR